jgi:NAD(P)-dependent dehydrogenase (short-subunit alcohol dehydrogenase family)
LNEDDHGDECPLRVLVAGADTAAGRAFLELLHSANYEVTALAAKSSQLGSLREEFGCHTIAADCTDYESARLAVEAAGTLEVLVNIAPRGEEFSFLTATAARLEGAIKECVCAPLNMARAVAASQIAQQRGAIIVNVVCCGRERRRAAVGEGTVSGAIKALTRSMDIELHPYHIGAYTLLYGEQRRNMGAAWTKLLKHEVLRHGHAWYLHPTDAEGNIVEAEAKPQRLRDDE